RAQGRSRRQPPLLRALRRAAGGSPEAPPEDPHRDGGGLDAELRQDGPGQLMDAGQLARALASLEAGELRARKAAAVLAALPPGDAVILLGHLIRRADRGGDPEAAAMEGLLRAVRDLLEEPIIEALYHAAEDDLEVQALFARSLPARNFDHDRE